MANNILSQRVAAARVRAEGLRRSIAGSSGLRSELATATLRELEIVLEELQVADEQIRQETAVLESAQRNLTQKQHYYQELFDLAPDAYCMTNPFGTIVEANRAAFELLNVAPDHLLRKPIQAFVDPAHRADLRNRLRQALRERSGFEMTVWLQPRLQEPREVHLAVRLMFDPQGQPKAVGWLVHDLTEHKQVEDQLRAAAVRFQAAMEAERTDIARELHDQLGQQLTVLKMEAARVQHGLAAEQVELRAQLDGMQEHIQATIDTMRQIATSLRASPVDEFGLVQAVAWKLAEFDQEFDVRCQLAAPDEELVLDAQRANAIFRAFEEALTNVARHAGASRVEVTIRQEPEAVALILRDNGRGITAQEMRATKSLGLLGMRERVRPFAGQVRLHGQPGVGTTVEIRVPRTGGAGGAAG